MENRYVITGLGQVSAMGNDVTEMRRSFEGSKQNFVTDHHEGGLYPLAKVDQFDFYKQGFNIKTYIDRASQLCTSAVQQAVVDSDSVDRFRTSLITASQFGCLDSASRYLHQLKTLKKSRFASPLYFMHSICNMPNSIASTELQVKGVTNHLAGSSEAGLMALWQGIQFMEAHQSDCVIAGGVDVLSDELIGQLRRFKLINPDPVCLSGPFDKQRKHAVWGEAAAFVRIEREESAISGSRPVYGIIKGIGIATSTSSRTRGHAIEESMRIALHKSGVQPGALTFIVANANGTIAADLLEAYAIHRRFGNEVPVFAPKSYFGETSSAAGVLGIISILARKGKRLPVNRYINESDHRIGIKVMYGDGENVEISEGSTFIVNGYNRSGVSVSACIEVCGGGAL